MPRHSTGSRTVDAPTYDLAMRLHATSSVLCVIDVQEKLLPVIAAADAVVSAAGRLADAARLLDVPAILTEQYPRGLGPTRGSLAEKLPPPLEKRSFSCCGCDTFVTAIPADRHQVVLAGLETHVCVAQTALDLLGRGYAVFLAVDAVAARHAIDHEAALRRLEAAGTVLTTSEAVLFEWCRSADHPRFQAVRRLVTG